MLFNTDRVDKLRALGKKKGLGTNSKAYLQNFKVESLTEDFYSMYPMWDRSVEHLGPEEFLQFTMKGQEGQALAPISNLLCYWPTTLTPINRKWAKGLSIVKNGVELVCRTQTCTQTNNRGIDRQSYLYICEICDNILIPNKSVFVYCYNYKDDCSEEETSKWCDTFLRVCFLHFVNHGENKNRPPLYGKMPNRISTALYNEHK